MSSPPRRLVFGEVAELYDAARPTYPGALIDDLVGWARDAAASPGAGVALEVGAGTGKATRLLAGRGVGVHAIEPSAEMAGIARRTTADGRAGAPVTVTVSDFEHADLGAATYPLVYSAQAWHWVSRPRGYAIARVALVPGGHLVAFWNHPRWERSDLRAELNAVYEAHVPASLRGGPLHPAPSESRRFAGQGWEAELAAVADFADAGARDYAWSLDYTAAGYADMLATLSEVRLLQEATRESLLAGVCGVIDAHGGAFTLAMGTHARIARAV